MAELPQVARALLDTIAGPESAGSYSVEYGGSHFGDFADHPRKSFLITSGPNKGQYSTAAGKYQFLGSTWDRVKSAANLPDFSPASQDAGAWYLAQDEYKNRTGRSLEDDLTAGDLSRVAPALKSQWTSMPGGIEQGINGSAFSNAFAKNLSKFTPGSSLSDFEALLSGNAPPNATKPEASTAPPSPGSSLADFESLLNGQGTTPTQPPASDPMAELAQLVGL